MLMSADVKRTNVHEYGWPFLVYPSYIHQVEISYQTVRESKLIVQNEWNLVTLFCDVLFAGLMLWIAVRIVRLVFPAKRAGFTPTQSN